MQQIYEFIVNKQAMSRVFMLFVLPAFIDTRFFSRQPCTDYDS